ncbi:TRAP transporter permease [Amorphus orientalis]|uniref:TRAP transporter 4TM/12TM fusion protein n=1 Tax=Amorphus orientalis TaxID=649198 RepID=A0AAE4ASH6_9HYPH|nr:TRAP transporter fused permease subunit [Amorphus orientalis]MDQ0315045.1 TRAP transporter 4TM/12TM fusion protein [Amorphus orientalis]
MGGETSVSESGVNGTRGVRLISTVLGALLAIAGLAWAADLYRMVGWTFLTEQFLAATLGLSLALVFVTRPLNRAALGPRRLPWYDAVLAVVSLAASAYMAMRYPDILSDFFSTPLDGLIVSWLLFVLVVEGLRRCSGWSLVIVVLAFTIYALVGHLVEGDLQTNQVDLNTMIFYLGVDTSGLFGIVLLVGVTVVIPFLFFGNLLHASGGASFFNDLALGLMGGFRGGAAKISILASTLFGSISGIVVSNIMATGIITIPMMKKSGFKPEQAAAIEASASNGGQLMPPVMGAVAFLMADFLQISYAEVAIAALVPAVLYYLALFIQADLEAGKAGILRVPASEIPRLVAVAMRGWFFILPFAVLIYALFTLNREPENAAIYACLTVMAVGFVIGYGGSRLTPRGVWRALVATGISAVDIVMISAAAGFIMGILQLTGLGFALTLLLVKLGSGNIFALLVIAGVMCIVLGMGMPTLGVYVLLAVLIAPSLVEVGIQPLAAHMFILYLGMMSFVTPPLAIAAFFAANIARASPMKTGWTAMRFSWTAYIIPFLFVFSPTLLLQSPSIPATVLSLLTATIAVWFVSAGSVGYGLQPMGRMLRVLAVVGGSLLLIPLEMFHGAFIANGIGAALVMVVLVAELAARRGRAAAAPEGAAE